VVASELLLLFCSLALLANFDPSSLGWSVVVEVAIIEVGLILVFCVLKLADAEGMAKYVASELISIVIRPSTPYISSLMRLK
jgi:hypothetical protein